MDAVLEQPLGRHDEEPYAEAPEPPITVAVLAGGPGNYAQRAASLASARNLLDQLQTAPYDTLRPSLRAMLGNADAILAEGAAAGSAEGEDSAGDPATTAQPADAVRGSAGTAGEETPSAGRTAESLPEHLRAGGIHVLTYWLDSDMAAHALSAADLMSRSVADLDFQPPSHTSPVTSMKARLAHPIGLHLFCSQREIRRPGRLPSAAECGQARSLPQFSASSSSSLALPQQAVKVLLQHFRFVTHSACGVEVQARAQIALDEALSAAMLDYVLFFRVRQRRRFSMLCVVAGAGDTAG